MKTMAKKLNLEESLKGETKSLNDEVNDVIQSNKLYLNKQRKRVGIYKALAGSGIASGVGYMLTNAYMGLSNPNAIYGFGMTYGQAEATGAVFLGLSSVTFLGGLFILFGAYLLKDGIEDLKNLYKKSDKHEIEKSE